MNRLSKWMGTWISDWNDKNERITALVMGVIMLLAVPVALFGVTDLARVIAEILRK